MKMFGVRQSTAHLCTCLHASAKICQIVWLCFWTSLRNLMKRSSTTKSSWKRSRLLQAFDRSVRRILSLTTLAVPQVHITSLRRSTNFFEKQTFSKCEYWIEIACSSGLSAHTFHTLLDFTITPVHFRKLPITGEWPQRIPKTCWSHLVARHYYDYQNGKIASALSMLLALLTFHPVFSHPSLSLRYASVYTGSVSSTCFAALPGIVLIGPILCTASRYLAAQHWLFCVGLLHKRGSYLQLVEI